MCQGWYDLVFMRTIRRFILALTIGLAGVWAVGSFFLPRYVENRAAQRLENLGFEVNGLSVAKLTFSQATVAGIRLTLPDGMSTLTVNTVDANFSISSLLEGHADRIVVHGSHLDLRGPAALPSSTPDTAISGDREEFSMPVHELEIASGSIRGRAGPFVISSSLSGAYQWNAKKQSVSGSTQIAATLSTPDGRQICEFQSADVTATFGLQDDKTPNTFLITSTIPDLRISGLRFKNTDFQAKSDSNQLDFEIRSHGGILRFDEIRGNYSMDSLNRSLRLNVETPSITTCGFSAGARATEFIMGVSTNAAFGEMVSIGVDDPVLWNCPVSDITGKFFYRSGILEGSFQPAEMDSEVTPNRRWRVSNQDEPSVVTIRSPMLSIHPDGSAGACLQSKLDAQVYADLLITGRFPLRDHSGGPTFHFGIRNGNFEMSGIEMESISGAIELETRGGIHSRGSQAFDIEKVNLGRLELENGHVEFTLESSDSILLEEMEWSVFGGRMTSLATRFAPSNPIARFDLICEELNLVEVLNTAFGRNFTGSGLLFGRLPIKVRRPPGPGIAFGDGYLYSRPGKGNLGFGRSPEVHAVIEKGILRNRPGLELDEVRKQVSQTLEDFEYTSLILKVGQTPGERPYGTLDIDGKGAHKHGVPIQFEIRFSVEPL